MADVTVKARVVLQDDASRSLVGLKGHLKDLMQGNVGAAMTGSLLAGNLMGLASGAMSAAGQIAQTTWELGKLGAESQRSQASFERLASGVGESGQAMLRAMQEASRGTVSNSDLMMAANRALVLGVADSAEEMADLVEAAIIRGRDVGVGATQAVNDLVTGIGRMSPETLDNLGIVGAQAQIEAYAASLGKTAQQLSDVEKKQALVNAVLASTEGVEIVDDAASSFERMETSIANAQSALGELFSPAVAAIAQDIANAAVAATDVMTTTAVEAAAAQLSILGRRIAWVRDEIESMQSVRDSFEFIDPGKAQAAQTEIDRLIGLLGDLVTKWNENAAITGAVTISLEDFGFAAVGTGNALRAASTGVDAMTRSVEQLQTALANASPLLGSLQSIRQGAIGQAESLAMQAVNLGADPTQVAAMLGETTDAIWNMGLAFDATTEAQFLNKVAAEGQLAGLEGLVGGLTDAQKAAAKFAKDGISEANKALDSLRSNVSGLVSSQLSGALSLDGISVPGGPRQDDVNENARRLAAIANEGLIGQDWLGEFAAEAPGTYADLMLKIAEGMDAQGAAQMLLGQFQSGLRPDLLDFDMIKQRVKDQLTSQQAIEEMTGELTSQLMAEMGVSAQQVQGALGALGLGGAGDGGTSAGDALSAGFEAGVDGSQIAAGSLAKIAQAFLDNEGKVRSSGAIVGAWWGEGFRDVVGQNVPPALLDLLTNLLLPRMQAAAAAAASQTGAP